MRGWEPIARKPGMALLMNATAALAYRKIVPNNFLFITNHAVLKILHALSHIYCLKDNAWFSWNCILEYEALMALSD